MNRRTFVYTGALSVIASQIGCANPNPPSTQNSQNLKTASVNIPQLREVITQQQCPSWCWVASISMIFHFYGHLMTQAEIVAATYGAVACLPSLSPAVIGQTLSRDYVDDSGVRFASRVTAAYDFRDGINTIDNAFIVNELEGNRPLIYQNTHHVMVVYAVDYFPTPGEPNVIAVHVVDPWPFSPSIHPLSQPEMTPAHLGGQMTFLASVRVI